MLPRDSSKIHSAPPLFRARSGIATFHGAPSGGVRFSPAISVRAEAPTNGGCNAGTPNMPNATLSRIGNSLTASSCRKNATPGHPPPECCKTLHSLGCAGHMLWSAISPSDAHGADRFYSLTLEPLADVIPVLNFQPQFGAFLLNTWPSCGDISVTTTVISAAYSVKPGAIHNA